MLKLKLQYFGHLMWRANSLEKTLMLEKIDGRSRRGRQRINWLESITDSVGMNLIKLRQTVKDRGAWQAAVHRVTKSQTWFSDQTTTNNTRNYHNIINRLSVQFSSVVQFSCSVMSKSWPPHGLQHARIICPSLSPGVCSDSRPLSRWCHPIISSSVVPFSSRLQSFPASGSFLMSQLFASGGQSIGALASASVLPIYIQGWFPLGLTGWISL